MQFVSKKTFSFRNPESNVMPKEGEFIVGKFPEDIDIEDRLPNDLNKDRLPDDSNEDSFVSIANILILTLLIHSYLLPG